MHFLDDANVLKVSSAAVLTLSDTVINTFCSPAPSNGMGHPHVLYMISQLLHVDKYNSVSVPGLCMLIIGQGLELRGVQG